MTNDTTQSKTTCAPDMDGFNGSSLRMVGKQAICAERGLIGSSRTVDASNEGQE